MFQRQTCGMNKIKTFSKEELRTSTIALKPLTYIYCYDFHTVDILIHNFEMQNIYRKYFMWHETWHKIKCAREHQVPLLWTWLSNNSLHSEPETLTSIFPLFIFCFTFLWWWDTAKIFKVHINPLVNTNNENSKVNHWVAQLIHTIILERKRNQP